MLLVALSRLRWRVTRRLVTIRPETVLRWHRALVAGKSVYSRARIGRPVITDDIRLLVVEMKKNNPRWGLRRIMGELRKIGVSLSKSSISNILNAAGYPPPSPRNREFVESWIPFLKSHGKGVFACDFLTVETAFLKRLYVFAFMDIKTRNIVSAVVTRNPTAVWLERVFRNCFMMAEYLPEFVVTDRDGIYGE